MKTSFRTRQYCCAAAMLLAVWTATPSAAGQSGATAHWVTTWTTSQQGLGDTVISNTTVRMIARSTIAGDSVRVRLDNTFGRAPLQIGRATVGHRVRGAQTRKGFDDAGDVWRQA